MKQSEIEVIECIRKLGKSIEMITAIANRQAAQREAKQRAFRAKYIDK